MPSPPLHHPLLDFLFPHSFGSMSMITLLSIVPLAYTTPSESEPALDQFRFATVYSNDMVLQSKPKRAVVWGMCPPGDTVTVNFAGQKIAATTQMYGGNSTWTATLPATAISFDGQVITATSTKATSNKTVVCRFRHVHVLPLCVRHRLCIPACVCA